MAWAASPEVDGRGQNWGLTSDKRVVVCWRQRRVPSCHGQELTALWWDWMWLERVEGCLQRGPLTPSVGSRAVGGREKTTAEGVEKSPWQLLPCTIHGCAGPVQERALCPRRTMMATDVLEGREPPSGGRQSGSSQKQPRAPGCGTALGK